MEVIDKLNSLDLEKAQLLEITKLVDLLKPLRLLGLEVPKGHSIYRARPTEAEAFSTSSELSYNPNPKSFGRCHYPGQSIFYGSIASETINYPIITNLAETSLIFRNKLPDVGKFQMTVGKWIVEKPFQVAAIVSDSVFAGKNQSLLNLSNSYNDFIESSPEYQETKFIAEYLAEQFSKGDIKNDFEYKLTAAICNKIYSNKINGILYPSVRTQGDGFNIAIAPQIVDSSLKLFGVGVHTIYHKDRKLVVDNNKFAYADEFGNYNLQPMTEDFIGEKIALKILNGELAYKPGKFM